VTPLRAHHVDAFGVFWHRLLVALFALALAPAAAGAAERPPRCPVDAPSAIVMEVSTAAVACATNADQRRSIASTTKLMTALLTLERAKLSDTFTAADYVPSPAESKIGLDPGERMSVRDLMRGLLVESANDAAATLARRVGGSQAAFVRVMNARARELGLTDTRYVDPIGLSAGNRSSARDLAALTRTLRRFRFFRRVVASPQVLLRTGAFQRRLANRNTLVGDPLVDGVKTGHTQRAGYVLVGSARRGRGARRIHVISVVLATASQAARDLDTLALLRWGVRRFRVVRPVQRGDALAVVPIRHRRGAELPLIAGRGVRLVVPRGTRLRRRIVGLPGDVAGPIATGQPVASVEILRGDRRVARVPLVAASPVPAAGLVQRTKDSLSRPVTVALALAALLASVLLARMGLQGRDGRTRRPRKEPEVA
jgi:serine-type D-Ala-D-Ala carboxypeptidase (penicillin-binding protein 5/6)